MGAAEPLPVVVIDVEVDDLRDGVVAFDVAAGVIAALFDDLLLLLIGVRVAFRSITVFDLFILGTMVGSFCLAAAPPKLTPFLSEFADLADDTRAKFSLLSTEFGFLSPPPFSSIWSKAKVGKLAYPVGWWKRLLQLDRRFDLTVSQPSLLGSPPPPPQPAAELSEEGICFGSDLRLVTPVAREASLD